MKRPRVNALAILMLGIVAAGTGWWIFSSGPQSAARSEIREDTQNDPRGPAGLPAASVTNKNAQVFAEFRSWTTAFLGGEQPDLKQGLELARSRSDAMVALIQQDPEAALQQAVGFAEYRRLPEEIRAFVEEPFSEVAAVSVMPVCSVPKSSTPAQQLVIELEFADGSGNARGFVYGNRLGASSKSRMPVQGVRLQGVAALSENVFQQLSPEDAAITPDLFPPGQADMTRSFFSGHPIPADGGVVAVAGGKRFIFSNADELAEFDAAVAALDGLPGPGGGSGLVFELPSPAPGHPFDMDALYAHAEHLASAWTETPKHVFVIRVDFPNHTAASFPLPSAAAIEHVFDTSVDAQVRAMSYGKTSIQATVASGVTRMPSPTGTYTAMVGNSSNNGLLHTQAKAAYLAANPGWVEGSYDIIAVYFGSIGMRGSNVAYGGLATLGGANLWLQDSFSSGLVAHEIGHNYGLGHASFWIPPAASSDPADPAGSNEEYGDLFDIMGDGSLPNGHFNVQGKALLNWISASDWADATAASDGTFRIHRIDHAQTTGLRGVRVTRGPDDFFWIGHRRAYENESLDYGAYLHWERPGFNRSWLLDTTPDSAAGDADKDDSGLMLGSTFSDATAGIHITPLARGGIAPAEWIDVRVHVGTSPGNQPPTATLATPASVPARTTTMLSVTANDPNGDPLAYAWSIDGIPAGENHPTLAHTWTVAANSTVRVTVSDMKGGTVTRDAVVTVTDTLNTWNPRSTGRSVHWKGAAQNGSRTVLVGRSSGAWAWSADGVTWTHGAFGLNEHLDAVCHDGTKFIAVGEKYDFAAPAGWRGFIATSTDGAAWTTRYFAGASLKSVAHGNGITVAGGDGGALVRSTDGISWTVISPSPVPTGKQVAGLAFGGGTFVATALHDNPTDGYNGGHQVLTSTNGSTWSDRTSGTNLDSWRDLRGVAWLNGRFYASGWYSGLMLSQDSGATFRAIRDDDSEFPALAFGSGISFAAGVDRGNANAPVAILSSDGIQWSPVPAAAATGVNAAIAFRNTFILAGDGDLIRQSATFNPAADGYVAWRDAAFPDRGADSQPARDADGDSLYTLVEYSFGTSPTSAAGVQGAALLPSAAVGETASELLGRLVLAFSIPDPAPTDIRYTVQASGGNLGTWTPIARKTGIGPWHWIAGGSPRVVVSTNAGRQSVRVGDTEPFTTAPRRFLRLVVEIAPAGG